jgi:hypothetical protein
MLMSDAHQLDTFYLFRAYKYLMLGLKSPVFALLSPVLPNNRKRPNAPLNLMGQRTNLGESAAMPPSEACFSRKNAKNSLLAGRWLRRTVRSGLPGPPRSPAQFLFPGAFGIDFDFPRLCHRRRGIGRSLPPRIGSCRQKCPPSLWPLQVFSGRNSRPCTETGSNVGRDRFEPGERPTNFH